MEKKLHLLGFTEEGVKEIKRSHQVNPIITLYSPISGKVIDIKVVPGEVVDQNKEIMTILDPKVLWVDAEIFEKDLPKVKIGQKVEVSVQAYPDKSFLGKITYVGDVLKDETRTINVRTEVSNPDLILKPGMFANIKIYIDNFDSALVVPEEAICDYMGEKFVFVVEGQSYQTRKVIYGAKLDGFYQVISGLKEGEEVVTEGSFQLKSKLFQEELKKSIHD